MSYSNLVIPHSNEFINLLSREIIEVEFVNFLSREIMINIFVYENVLSWMDLMYKHSMDIVLKRLLDWKRMPTPTKICWTSNNDNKK